MEIASVARHLPRLASKNGPPLHLTFFVTARCNALCNHCFYWESLNQNQKELTLDEVDKIAASLDRVLWVAFTGGEPFLRKDLPEFAKILHDRLRPVTLSINTNGIKTDSIVAAAEKLAANCPRTFVGILCSLDGLAATHDRIRGVPKNFEKTVRTFRELKKLKAKLPNLGVGISTTFCAWNQDEMDEMYELVVNELVPDNWDLSFVRGKPMEPAIGVADIGKYRRIKNKLEHAFAAGKLHYYDGMPLSKFVHAKERLSTRTVLKTLETGQFQVPCYAGGAIRRDFGGRRRLRLRDAGQEDREPARARLRPGQALKKRTRGGAPEFYSGHQMLLHPRVQHVGQSVVQPSRIPKDRRANAGGNGDALSAQCVRLDECSRGDARRADLPSNSRPSRRQNLKPLAGFAKGSSD